MAAEPVPTGRPFLTARWLDLVLLNYRIPDELVTPLVPAGTRLDRFEGALLASVVGFRFADTRVRGIPIPFHRRFEEVNLRFYVAREAPGADPKRGVVFVRELVPRRAIAWIANLVYHEPYRRAAMGHRILRPGPTRPPTRVEYRWSLGHGWCRLGGDLVTPPAPLAPGSEAEFVTEHYWGYNRQRDGATMEYQVTHPRWTVAPLGDARLIGDVAGSYGDRWAAVLTGPPASAYYATGSAVAVYPGHRIVEQSKPARGASV